jgi:polysaccharide export outer membrane protein
MVGVVCDALTDNKDIDKTSALMPTLPCDKQKRLSKLKRKSQGLSLGLLMAATLSGCAWAPGLHMSGAAGQEAGKRTTLLSVLNKPAEDDTPPPGTLTEITPQLIRQQRATQEVNAVEQVKHLFGKPQPYTIGAGDVLSIVVWGHPEFAMANGGPAQAGGGAGTAASFTGAAAPMPETSATALGGQYVSAEGTIQFPYVGSLSVAGMSEAKARDALVKKLSRYIKDPQVTLRIQAYRSNRLYIEGDVRAPGLVALNDLPMTLPEALARAGGLLPSADRSAISITRGDQTTLINLQKLTEENINPNQILLAAGDMVRVTGREDAKVYVLGEVTAPKPVPMRYGKLTLNEALGEAIGLSQISSDPSQVYVMRNPKGDQPEIFHLNASTPYTYILAEGFQLRPRDVVYVDPAPIVRWNRVISLLLPSASAITVTRSAVDPTNNR